MATHKINADVEIEGNITVNSGGPKIILTDSTDDDDQQILFKNSSGAVDYRIHTSDFTGAGGGDGMYIGSTQSDGEVCLVTHDTIALTLDTSQNATFAGDITVGDDVFISDSGIINLGNSNDLQVNHDGSNSYVNHVGTGDLILQNTTDDKDIVFKSDNGSGGVATYFFLDGSQANTSFQKDIIFADSKKALFGGGGDLQIYHDGSHSIIDNNTGDLKIICDSDDIKILAADDVVIRDHNDSTEMAKFINGGAVELYHNGSKKLETKSDGVDITGELQADTLDVDGNADIAGSLNVNTSMSGGAPSVVIKDSGRSGSAALNYISLTDSANATHAKIGYLSGLNTELTLENLVGNTTLGSSAQINIKSGGSQALALDSSQNATFAGTVTLPSSNTLTGSSGKVAFNGRVSGSTPTGTTDFTTKAYVDLQVANLVDSAPSTLNTLNELADALGDDVNFSTTVTNSIATKLPLAGGTMTGNITFGSGLDIIFPDNSGAALEFKEGSNLYMRFITTNGGEAIQMEKATTISNSLQVNALTATSLDLNGNADISGKLVLPQTSTTIGSSNVGNASLLVGSTSAGIGIDSNEIAIKGDHLYIGAIDNGKSIIFRTDASTAALTLDSDQNATFTGSITIPDYIKHASDADTFFGFSAADTFKIHVANEDVLRVNGGGTTNEAAVSILCGGGTNAENIGLLLSGNTNGETLKVKINNPNTSGNSIGAGILSYEPDGDTFNIGQSTTHNNMAISIDNSENVTFKADITCGDDLFMPSAGVINFNSGDMTITHASNKLTVAGGTLAFGNTIIDTGSIVQIKNSTEFQDSSENTTMEFAEDSITFSQSDTIIEGKCKIRKRKFEVSSTSHGNSGGGDVVFFGSGSLTAGKIYYYTSGGAWALTDADAVATADGMIGVALGSSSGSGVMLRGMTTLNHDPGTVGDPLYLSTTAGQATSTAPSGNGDIVRVIGYCLGSTNGEIYFNPSGTFVEVTA